MSPATRLKASFTAGEQPEPLTFERFMATYWHLPGRHRERLFWALPTDLQDTCWRELRARVERERQGLL